MKIPALPAATALTGFEPVPLVQNDEARRASVAAIAGFGVSTGSEGAAILAAVQSHFASDDGLDDIGAPLNPISKRLRRVEEARGWRSRQLILSQAYRYRDIGGGINMVGDSIGKGAYSGLLYTNHFSWGLKRGTNATFGGTSMGWFPMTPITYATVPQLAGDTPHTVTFHGNWGAVHGVGSASQGYPIGLFGPAAAHTMNGKSNQTSDPLAKCEIIVPAIQQLCGFQFKKSPGYGVWDVYVNDILVGSIDQDGPFEGNARATFPLKDRGDGFAKVELRHADADIVNIHDTFGLFNVVDAAHVDHAITFNNYSENGATLTDLTEDAIISLCRAPAVVVARGINDWSGYDTDNNNAAFAAFVQRIDWFIQYCQLYNNKLVVADFIWYADLETSRTRRELKRLADACGGEYLDFPDQFFANGRKPVMRPGGNPPTELNAPMELFADDAHPFRIFQEAINCAIAQALGLAVDSIALGVAWHDWAWPVTLTNPDIVNINPDFPRLLSTIRQRGAYYEINLMLKPDAPGNFPVTGGFVAGLAAPSPKYRGGLAFTENYVAVQASHATGLGTVFAQVLGTGAVNFKITDAFVDRIVAPLSLRPLNV